MRKQTILAAALLSLAALPARAQTTPAEHDHITSPAQPAAAPAQQTPSPEGAKVYIISPANGARVRSPVLVQFGLKGMGVTQAGSSAPDAGHHHLLLDVTGPVSETDVIPSDKQHLHFGRGQTETTLDLAPGRHTLQLVLGDARHRPFSPMVASQKIEITVVTGRRHRRPGHHYHGR